VPFGEGLDNDASPIRALTRRCEGQGKGFPSFKGLSDASLIKGIYLPRDSYLLCAFQRGF
jgi:hypothetical protein